MARKDEIVSMEIFEKYLQAFFERREIVRHDGGGRLKPPDFYLELPSKKFAVEVTSVHEQIEDMEILTYLKSIESLVNEVEEEANRDGYFHGQYVVKYKAPFKNFGSIRRELKSALLTYFRETQALSKAPEKELHKNYNEYCGIVKVGNQRDEVQRMGPPRGINIDGVANHVCRLFKKVLTNKLDKLKAIKLPKILLVQDWSSLPNYGLKNPDERNKCAASLSEHLDEFRAVFVIQDDTYGFPFHPPESEWGRSLFL